MDNLRDVLKATFIGDNASAKLLAGGSCSCKDLMEMQKSLKDSLYLMNLNKTYDQIDVIVDYAFRVWREKGDDQTLSYCKKNSPFNILLYFAKETLLSANGQPVCRYNQLLRWHETTSYLGEDLFVISYLASKDCCLNHSRTSFIWDEYIGHDNVCLKSLFGKPMSELHAHLKGSSSIFYINWLSLMNNISKQYINILKLKKRKHLDVLLKINDVAANLQLQVVQAAAIRFYLTERFFLNNPNNNILNLLTKILKAEYVGEIENEILELQSEINAYASLYAYRYDASSDSSDNIVDYAIWKHRTFDIDITDKRFFLSVLSGERTLMYKGFQYVYGNNQDEIFPTIHDLFFKYLRIKARFMQEIVQLNTTAGFANFMDYDSRKTLFIANGSIYDRLIPFMSVASFLYDKPDKRYLETRITPKNSLKKFSKSVATYDKSIQNPQFVSNENLYDWKYRYIIHFIKKEDDGLGRDENDDKVFDDFHCRHYDLRKQIRKESYALYNYRKLKTENSKKVVGIDAANSEIFCRPEVFAQSFRFLTARTFEDDTNSIDLGITYHAGEDYYDVVDGLRAVDETLNFLNLTGSDRLGHALVLGENVSRYYMSRNKRIMMPKQVLLDNVVWLYSKITRYNSYNAQKEQLKSLFEELFFDVFGECGLNETISINTYYKSWLLRGDNPECYNTGVYLKSEIIDRWSLFDVNENEEVRRIRAINDSVPCRLYCLYHFNKAVKERGSDVFEWHVDEDMIALIDNVREDMLSEVEKRQVCIECNLTSNFKIGSLPQYVAHPITSFFNYQLGLGDRKTSHALKVSINTDDKGVFGTSLEREYSLISLALEKEKDLESYHHPVLVYDWLERIREMGEQSKFDKIN